MLKPSHKEVERVKPSATTIITEEEDVPFTEERLEQMKFLTEAHEFFYKKFKNIANEVIYSRISLRLQGI